MKPFINWQELQDIGKPPIPPRPNVDGPQWGKRFATFYNRMAAMEKSYTLNQVNALPLLPTDSLLDMGCGPGRLSIPLAQRVNRVTSLDVSEDVLAYCRRNADAAGVKNLTTMQIDFHDAVAGGNVAKHDVVICSRSVALHHLEKLSGFANRMAAIVSFANAPSIPHLLSDIFKGTSAEPAFGTAFGGYGQDRRLNYNVLFNIAYDLGYEPNIRVVEDGFTKDYGTREEAYDDIITLGKVDGDRIDIYRRNLDRYLSEKPDGGVSFFIETRTCVIWWEVNPKRYF